MKKEHLVLCMILINMWFSYAQKVDSLLREELYAYRDTMTYLINDRKLEQAIQMGYKIFDKYKEHGLKDDYQMADVYIEMSTAFGMEIRYDSSIPYAHKALNLLNKLKIKKSIVNLKVYTNLGIIAKEQGDVHGALKNFKKIVEAKENMEIKDFYSFAMSYDLVGNTYSDMGDMENALLYLEKAKQIRLEKLGKDEPSLWRSYLSIGEIHGRMHDFKESIRNYTKAIAVFSDKATDVNEDLSFAYAYMGRDYKVLREYEKSEEYFFKAIEMSKSRLRYLALHYGDLASLYAIWGKYEKALRMYKLSIETTKEVFGDNSHYLVELYFGLGEFLSDLDNFEEAILALKKAVNISLNYYGENYHKTSEAFYMLARGYEGMGEYEKARENYFKARDIQFKLDRKDEVLLDSYLGLARLAWRVGDHKGFDKYLNKSLRSYNVALRVADNGYSVKKLELLDSYCDLKNKKYEKFYKETVNSKYLDSIENTNDIRIQIQESFQQNLMRENARYHQIKLNHQIYESAIKYALKRNKMEKAFSLVEKIKSRQLIQNIRLSDAKYSAMISDSLLVQKSRLERGLTRLQNEQENYRLSNEQVHDSVYNKLALAQSEMKHEYDILMQSIYDTNPEYKQLKNSHEVTSIKELQSKLTNKNTVVEYFIGEESSYAFVIKKNEYLVRELKLDASLKSWVKRLRNGIIMPHSSFVVSDNKMKQLAQDYNEMGYLLYEKLWKPIEDVVTEEVIVVPDGVLNFIPFEALLTSKEDQYSYLIKKHQISYNYSATLSSYLSERKIRLYTHGVLAIAPDFQGENLEYRSLEAKRAGLSKLEFNITEARSIVAQLEGKVLTGGDATAQNLAKYAGDFNIIHLATHAKSNDEMGDSSYIAFQKEGESEVYERFYVRDIYGLNLNSDLVVLSACETGWAS